MKLASRVLYDDADGVAAPSPEALISLPIQSEGRPLGRPSCFMIGSLTVAVVSENAGASLSDRRGSRRKFSACGLPVFVRLHLQPKLFIIDPKEAVGATHDSTGHHGLDFVSHHADIGFVAAVVAETIEAEAVVEMAEQHDVM